MESDKNSKQYRSDSPGVDDGIEADQRATQAESARVDPQVGLSLRFEKSLNLHTLGSHAETSTNDVDSKKPDMPQDKVDSSADPNHPRRCTVQYLGNGILVFKI